MLNTFHLTRTALGALALLALTGCKSIGPDTVARDRHSYSDSIAESWKRQTLLNIVKLRYLDPPIFVDVGQIISGYTLETALSAGGAVSSDPAGSAIGGSSASLGGSVRYTDRPTVTYLPMTGNKFMRALMTGTTKFDPVKNNILYGEADAAAGEQPGDGG